MSTDPPLPARAPTRVLDIETPVGVARAHVHRPPRAGGTLVLSHGAGGTGWTGDLVSVTDAMTRDGWAVVLVEQPWRVAGKKVASPTPQLDLAWVAVMGRLRSGRGALPGPVVSGGRSSGARVACRTAVEVGADAVLALAFPLHPPGRPERSRAAELRLPIEAGLPVRVVQGRRDPWGSPEEIAAALPTGRDPAAYLAAVTGTHSFGRNPLDVVEAVRGFVAGL